jgi:hypothetical protein
MALHKNVRTHIIGIGYPREVDTPLEPPRDHFEGLVIRSDSGANQVGTHGTVRYSHNGGD